MGKYQPTANKSRIKEARIHAQKKTYDYQERCEKSRRLFREKVAAYRPEDLVYMDESGINSNESYPYGWSQKGERVHSYRPGKRRKRLSIVGALCQNKFWDLMVDRGYCTAKVNEEWVRYFLLPHRRPGQVIIMDNAPFHNSNEIRKQLSQAGVSCSSYLAIHQT